ncbi:uncharacterized protein LOC115624851 [Scaptodrosophila lebanonensis]|uniref:Uncharacterized protein LOC115624851 n=1 Tax=Drosophila lebanonensis TaxID=7225 RepID=A0A6J2TFP4_DROLE|nr:uncharacterized protein LOC115624851 [Scaptodrosophila lebanonensis]
MVYKRQAQLLISTKTTKYEAIYISIISVVCWATLLKVNALNITECDSYEGYKNNTRLNCSYSVIWCDGNYSMFCSEEDVCDESFNCSTEQIEESSTTSPAANADIDITEACTKGMTQKFVYPHNCNYYYYCIDGFLLVGQCPLGYVFNTENQVCSGSITDINGCVLT